MRCRRTICVTANVTKYSSSALWKRCTEATWCPDQPGGCSYANTTPILSYSCNQTQRKKEHRPPVSSVISVVTVVSVVISDAVVVDCVHLLGLLPPAPPANPAFPVRPLAQTAGHANLLSPLMFSRNERKKLKVLVSAAPLRHCAA